MARSAAVGIAVELGNRQRARGIHEAPHRLRAPKDRNIRHVLKSPPFAANATFFGDLKGLFAFSAQTDPKHSNKQGQGVWKGNFLFFWGVFRRMASIPPWWCIKWVIHVILLATTPPGHFLPLSSSLVWRMPQASTHFHVCIGQVGSTPTALPPCNYQVPWSPR